MALLAKIDTAARVFFPILGPGNGREPYQLNNYGEVTLGQLAERIDYHRVLITERIDDSYRHLNERLDGERIQRSEFELEVRNVHAEIKNDIKVIKLYQGEQNSNVAKVTERVNRLEGVIPRILDDIIPRLEKNLAEQSTRSDDIHTRVAHFEKIEAYNNARRSVYQDWWKYLTGGGAMVIFYLASKLMERF